jgi:hypothetical protein
VGQTNPVNYAVDQHPAPPLGPYAPSPSQHGDLTIPQSNSASNITIANPHIRDLETYNLSRKYTVPTFLSKETIDLIRHILAPQPDNRQNEPILEPKMRVASREDGPLGVVQNPPPNQSGNPPAVPECTRPSALPQSSIVTQDVAYPPPNAPHNPDARVMNEENPFGNRFIAAHSPRAVQEDNAGFSWASSTIYAAPASQTYHDMIATAPGSNEPAMQTQSSYHLGTVNPFNENTPRDIMIQAPQSSNAACDNQIESRVFDSRGADGEQEEYEDEPEGLVSRMRLSGDPDPALRVCPNKNSLDYSTTWYYLDAEPSFLICTRCYEKHIKASALASSFKHDTKPQGRCRFYVPRVSRFLWPTAKRTGDLEPLANYMKRRVSIPDCKQWDGVLGKDGIRWFGLVSRDIEYFAACEACYEDVLLDSSFRDRFHPHPTVQGAGEKWICDLSADYARRAAEKFPLRKDIDNAWGEFMETLKKCFALPKCDGQAVVATGSQWYRPKQRVEDLDFCETCFLNNFGMTSFESEFERVNESFEQRLCMRICDLHPINIREAIWVCRSKRWNFDIYIEIVRKILSYPRCSKHKGIANGKWYNFRSTVDNYGVCEACHAGILVPHGVAEYWTPEPSRLSHDGEAFCAFNPTVLRYNDFIKRWIEAIHTGVWSTYEDYVRKWAAIPVCQGLNKVQDKEWYGWNDCTICPQCYTGFAAGTSLVESFELNNTRIDAMTMCCLYSPRMKEKYAAACAVGDPAELLEFSLKRSLIYEETVPRVQMLSRMQSMSHGLAISQMMLSQAYAQSNAMKDWVTPSPVQYGNSSVGYYSSVEGVEGAKLRDEASASLTNQSYLGQAEILAERWKTVE